MKSLIPFLIKCYRSIAFIFPVRCKFYPTCSYYAEEAFKKYNFIPATLLVVKRLLKCNWFSKGGIDPLP